MSNKYLGPADRRLIAEKWAAYASVREIAALVGVAPKTIYQELRRGSNGTLDKFERGRPMNECPHRHGGG